MKQRWRCSLFQALFIAFFPLCPLYAQRQKEVQYIKAYLDGHEVQVTYRAGGPLYGTFFFLDVYFCASGRYLLFGQRRKQTVLGNEQVNKWNDSGIWDVIIFQGHAVLQYVATSGARDRSPWRFCLTVVFTLSQAPPCSRWARNNANKWSTARGR